MLGKRAHIYVCLSIAMCGCGTCANDPLNVDVSSNQQKVAISFLRDCGATTGFSTHVSILGPSGRLPNTPGNVFILDGKWPISVRWEGDNRLLIAAGNQGEAFKQLGEFEGVTIDYR